MSESLSEDQLAELIHGGRINTSRSAVKKHQAKKIGSINNMTTKTQTSVPRPRDSTQKVDPTASTKELDQEWLKAEKEKAERNIVAQRQDKRRREEMRESSMF